MKDDMLKKIEDLYDLDKHQEIIDMIEALPAEQLNNELILNICGIITLKDKKIKFLKAFIWYNILI